MAILLNGWISPIGGVSSGSICVCSLCRRLVFVHQIRNSISKWAEGPWEESFIQKASRLVSPTWQETVGSSPEILLVLHPAVFAVDTVQQNWNCGLGTTHGVAGSVSWKTFSLSGPQSIVL